LKEKRKANPRDLRECESKKSKGLKRDRKGNHFLVKRRPP